MPSRRNVLLAAAATTVPTRRPFAKSFWPKGRIIMWRRIMDDMSFERMILHRDDDEVRLEGSVFVADKSIPLEVEYTIIANGLWETKRVSVDQRYGGTAKKLILENIGNGSWLIDGRPAPQLHGCSDVDLGISPSTNALPINRRRASVGSEFPVRAAWVRFPQLSVVAAEQSYRRLDSDRYVYFSKTSGFRATIDVDPEGLPIDYSGVWQRIAVSPAVVGIEASEDGKASVQFAEALASESGSPSLGDAVNDFDWLVGKWIGELTDTGPDGTKTTTPAEWLFSWVLEGQAMQDVLISPPRGVGRQTPPPTGRPNRYGTTVRTFDHATNLWRIAWFSPLSGKMNLLAGRRCGSSIILNGDEGDLPIRWSFNDITPNRFTWRGETQNDEGKWITDAQFVMTRSY